MKLLLLVTLLTGATAHSVSPRAVWQFGNVFVCIFPLSGPFEQRINYGCYCSFFSPDLLLEDLDRCCRARDKCLAQVDYLGNCGMLIRNPYTTSYSYSCSGTAVTCSDKNNPCEAFICNCDRQAGICFSKTPYTDQFKGNHC
ncbi:phospholipase A2-like isoform X2 [Mesocricetus auratus]|uniref:Phospholipase A2 n=1 Tax=Mesocricetus auratus TaxID=10036 RepID=A0ABM2WGG2_MESAU|nr:phospholipase A2-like isoform X2 [Mesocricetus auratus]